ncbi:hypothetical protein KPMX200_170315 [Klebsiella pneumoniae]|nr:hypothetical protein KPMX200_170315 [Klebsiella pneumoniae]
MTQYKVMQWMYEHKKSYLKSSSLQNLYLMYIPRDLVSPQQKASIESTACNIQTEPERN